MNPGRLRRTARHLAAALWIAWSPDAFAPDADMLAGLCERLAAA